MDVWEARQLEKFSEAFEDAVAKYLNDKAMRPKALEEYFGDYSIRDKVVTYLDVLRED